MRVRTGYSEEVSHNSWIKGDVDLDSTDLEALAAEHGFESEGLTLTRKYGILSTEAEKLLTIKYIRDIQLKAPGSRDMSLLEARLQKAASVAAGQIELAKRASSGGAGEENS